MTEDDPAAVAAQLYARFQAGDIDGVIELLDPQIVWELVGPEEIPYFGRYEGIDGARAFFASLGEHCIVEAFVVDRVTRTDDGAVAEGSERAHYAGRSASYDMRWCHVMRIESGRITSFVDHVDSAPMLAAWRS